MMDYFETEEFRGIPSYMKEEDFSFSSIEEIRDAIEVYKTVDKSIDLKDVSNDLSVNLKAFWDNVWKFKYLPEWFLRGYNDFADYEIIIKNQKLSEKYILFMLPNLSYLPYSVILENQQIGERNILEFARRMNNSSKYRFWKIVSKTQRMSVHFIYHHMNEIDFKLLTENPNLDYKTAYEFGAPTKLKNSNISLQKYLAKVVK